MNTITTNNPNDTITQLKHHMEPGQMRITFLWPEDVEQVYIFKTSAHENHNFSAQTAQDGKLFTLQEYKKQGGYTCPRPSGSFVYRIYPFIKKEGKDFIVVCDDIDNYIEVTGQIPINFCITEKKGFLNKHKTYTVTLTAQQSIPGDVLCYVKKENTYPVSPTDGIMYFFGDGLVAGSTGKWDVKVKKNEYIRVFVRDKSLNDVYILKGERL